MKKKIQSEQAKKIIKLILILSSVLAVLSILNLAHFYYQSEKHVKTYAQKATYDAAVIIEKNIKGIEKTINSFAALSTERSIPDSEMKSMIKTALQSNDALFGIVIAYAPYQHSNTEKLHSLYGTHKNSHIDFTSVEKTYDYTDGEIEWYKRPIQEGAVWSEPFWGKASNAMVVTYSVPVFKKNSAGDNRHIATISAVCSLDNLNNLVASLDLGSSGYGFIVDQDGTFIAHPAEKLVTNKVTITGYAEKNYGPENQRIISKGLSNFAPFSYQEPTKLTKQMGVISMQPIKSTRWFVGSVLVKTEIAFPQKDTKRQWSYCLLMFVFFLCLSVAYRVQIPELSFGIRTLLIPATILTITFSLALLATWGLEIKYGSPAPHENDGFVSDKGSLSKFMWMQTQAAIEKQKETPTFIPTGMLVNSLEFVGLSNVRVSGVIWQRIPTELAASADRIIEESVRLPTATKLSMEQAFRSEEGDSTIVGVNFTAELQQNFDNTLYPFDRIQVTIPIRQRHMFGNKQLVPDFSSYPVYAPSSKALVAKVLLLPGWRIKQTYFSLLKKEYSTTFGFSQSSKTEAPHDLVINLTLQREILSGIISTFLPLFVLALIMYNALLLSSNDEKKIKALFFRPANMQMVAGSFLLFLVFSTINIRNNMISDSILYVEYIFFLMYLIVFGLVVSSLKITHNTAGSIIGSQDGYFIKSMYWPLVTGSMYFIAAAVFF